MEAKETNRPACCSVSNRHTTRRVRSRVIYSGEPRHRSTTPWFSLLLLTVALFAPYHTHSFVYPQRQCSLLRPLTIYSTGPHFLPKQPLSTPYNSKLQTFPNSDGLEDTGDSERRIEWLANGDKEKKSTSIETTHTKFSSNTSSSDNLQEDEDDDDDIPLTYSCRIVAASDGKIPTKPALLPKLLFQHPLELLNKIDAIYHAEAHEATRNLKFMMENTKGKRQSYEEDEEARVVSLLRASLEDAGFEPLSRRDLDLCEALNDKYLLRLSIQEDLEQLDPSISREFYPELYPNETLKENEIYDGLYEGRVLVFWRGYGEEVTKGRLLLPKIDYLQARVVQRVAFWLRRRINLVEEIIARQSKSIYRKVEFTVLSAAQNAIDMIPSERVSNWTQVAFVAAVERKKREERATRQKQKEEKMFKLQRYGGYRKGLVVNSSPAKPDDALAPFMLCEVDYGTDNTGSTEDAERMKGRKSNNQDQDRLVTRGTNSRIANQTLNGAPESILVEHDIYEYLNQGRLSCQYDDEMIKSGRGTSQPMQLLERVSISNLVDISPAGRRNVLMTFFAKNELIEPTYEEVVVIWRPLPPKPEIEPVLRPPKLMYDFADMFDIEGLPELPKLEKEETQKRPAIEIRTFAGVPMANLPAVLPKTKLVFRPADAVVFDLVSIISFVLVLGSQRFDNPRLDLLALVSFSLWVVRTVFRYSNKLARYDLLVKNFLTSKITHRNSGSLKYIATEAGSYRATRAALVFTWLTSPEREVTSAASNSREQLIKDGLVGVNAQIGEDKQVRVDIAAALRDLQDLELIRFSEDGQRLESVVRDTPSVLSALSNYWAEVFEGGKSFVDTARVAKGSSDSAS